jgi:hypothetical protein
MSHSKLVLILGVLCLIFTFSCEDPEVVTPGEEEEGTEGIYSFSDNVQSIEITRSGDIWALVWDGDVLSNIFRMKQGEDQFTKLAGFDTDFNTGTAVSGFAIYDLKYDAFSDQIFGLALNVLGEENIIFKINASDATIEVIFSTEDTPLLDLTDYFFVLDFDGTGQTVWTVPSIEFTNRDLYKLDLSTSPGNLTLIDSAYVFTPKIFFTSTGNPIAISPLSHQYANNEEFIKFVSVTDSGPEPLVEVTRNLAGLPNEFYDFGSLEITPANDLYIVSVKQLTANIIPSSIDRYNFLTGELLVSIPFPDVAPDFWDGDVARKMDLDNIDRIWVYNSSLYDKAIYVGLNNEIRVLDSSNSNLPEDGSQEYIADFHKGFDGVPWITFGKHILQIREN